MVILRSLTKMIFQKMDNVEPKDVSYRSFYTNNANKCHQLMDKEIVDCCLYLENINQTNIRQRKTCSLKEMHIDSDTCLIKVILVIN